ncbi:MULTISPECIES: TonB-dependent receptor [Acidobacteriaceae]|uniref:TonB-dependent receptor n=1 Tax=Acidobacteriaceae TaxID=204434 RepID=UPI00131CB4B2|nr:MULTISPECIES: carboxypeptidase regulatory-like domain-containing protein [Acidobacteriaceae]MDW5265845.1 carboxypeptidase regulatory-like domain-containing protein [Edaphobacter sp.]
MTKLLKVLSLIAVVVFGVSLTATAQSTSAQLTGKITDSSGAVVPHARVTAKNTGTNLTKTSESDDVGVYSLVSLPPGEYSLTTEAQGFATRIQTGIVLTVAQSATLDIALQIGGTQDTITVNGGAELINTTTAEISQVIGEDSIKDLPLNGRDPSSLVNLSVGVTNELASQASTLPGSNSFPLESGASAGGQRQGSTWYLLDGVANMDTFALLAAPFPNADATQEFRVISNNFDARYGFAPSAVVSIQTKSGTNQFHGGAFEFIRNNDLNASNWFSGAVDPLKRNQFGGYIGGPIFKDKLFFFTNYQGTRSHYQASTNSTDTPTQAMLNGDFSAVPAGDIDGPLAGVFQTVNGKPNQVNPNLFSTGALAIAKSLPLGQDPSTGLTNYAAPAQKFTYNENTTRFDYTINPNQRVFLRSFTYLYNQPGASVPGDILAGVNGQNGTYLNLVAGHTWTVTPSLLNSATLSWAEIDFSTGTIEKDAGGSPICLSRYINVSDPVGQCYIGGLSAFDGNVLYGGGLGFNAFTGNPNDTRRRYWWFTDTATKTIGKHTLTFGTDIMHRYGFEFYGGSVNPAVSFNGQYTGFPLSDFLLGYLNNMSQGAGESGSESGYMIGIYAQDQFKLLPNLTFTAGLRWDPNFPLQVSGGRGAAFVPGQQSTRYPNAPLGLVFPGDHGINDGLMPTTYGYFEPRIGLAWQVHPDTVLRAGFGLFTTPLEDAFYNHVWDTAPFAPSYGLSGGGTTPLSFDNPWSSFTSTGGKSPFPPFASPSQLPPSNAAFITPLAVPAVFASNFKLGITQSWNLSLEQSFGNQFVLHLAYVGSESFHQATTVDQNPGGFVCPPGVAPNPNNCGDVRSTYTNFAQIIQVQPAATSSYNALQAGVEKRFSHGLQFQSNFTWSHDTDVGGSGDPSFESSVSDPHSVGHDRGPSSLNYPVVSVSNLVYRLPLLAHKNALIKNTLGGWEISGLYTAQSGPPFTINGGQGNNNSGFLVGQDRADAVSGQPLQVRQGGKSHWVHQYLNPAAFTNNAYGTAGNSKKFSIQEAPISTADLAVIKNWSIYDRYKVQFRWEAFNALNHPSFGQPDSNPGDSNFGQITSIGSVAPRVMQGGIKFSF